MWLNNIIWSVKFQGRIMRSFFVSKIGGSYLGLDRWTVLPPLDCPLFYKRGIKFERRMIEVASPYTKDFGLAQLKKYYQKLNRIPIRKDFRNNKWIPSYNWYAKHFNGSFQNACFEAGILKNKPKTKEERVKCSLDILKSLSLKLQRCPTTTEYENNIKETNAFSRRVLENHLGMKYNDICRKYLLQFEPNNIKDTDPNDVIQELYSLKRKLGHTPQFKELKENGIYYSYNVFHRLFGKTYNALIESLGWDMSNHNITPVYATDDEMLNGFYDLFLKLGRVPYCNEIDEEPSIPVARTYSDRFGSVRNACDILGLDYEKYYQGAGAGKIVYDDNSELCRSLAERDITNYLIRNHIQYKKEISYSTIIQGDTRRFDWKACLGGVNYLIEYFGLYNNGGSFIEVKYRERTRRKIRDLYKAGVIDQCIFIFPYDIANKTLDEIFEPYLHSYNN